MKAFLRAPALLACLLPMVAAAQTQQVNVFSFENTSCSAWSKTEGNKLLRAQYEFWIRGFVSGHNYANPARQVQIGTLPGSEQLYHFLDVYCKDNPSLSFVGGAIRLVEELREHVAPVKMTPARPAAKPAPAVKPAAQK